MTSGIYTFENFVVNKENLFTYSVCRSVAEGGEGVFEPVIISGPGGCGKTHLLYSVYGELVKAGRSVAYMDTDKFIDTYILPDRCKSLGEVEEDVLLIDDGQVMMCSEATQTEVYRALRKLCSAGKRVIMAMDVPLADMPAFCTEANSLKAGEGLCLLDISTPTREFKTYFIKEICKMNGVELDEDSVSYLADNMGCNLRVIKGCIKMIRFYQDISSADIDLCWLKKNITNEMKGA